MPAPAVAIAAATAWWRPSNPMTAAGSGRDELFAVAHVAGVDLVEVARGRIRGGGSGGGPSC
ncbi:MAG TPA: hypothetical protein VF516_21785 [Kofleriaceae bacterium]